MPPLTRCSVVAALAISSLFPLKSVAGPRACLQPVEAAGGWAFVVDATEAVRSRCVEALAGSWGVAGGTVDCLLHLHDARGAAPGLDHAAIATLVRFLEESPLPPGPGLDAPVLLQAAELLGRAAPETALLLAKRLLAFGGSPARLARGLPLLANVGGPTELEQLALLTTTGDLALRRVAAHVAARRAAPELLALVLPLAQQDDDRTALAVLDGLAMHRPIETSALLGFLRFVPEKRRTAFAVSLARGLRPTSDAVLTPVADVRALEGISAGFDTERARWAELDRWLGDDPLATLRPQYETPGPRCEHREFLLETDAVLRSRPPPPPKPPPAPVTKKKQKRKSR